MLKYVLYAAVLFQASAMAQGRPSKAPWSVKLDATFSPPGPTQELIVSLLSREIRSLGDVAIVDSGENFTLRVLAMTDTAQDGRPIGYVFAAVFTTRGVEGSEYYDDLYLISGPMTAMQESCQRIIARLDAMIEKWRKIVRGPRGAPATQGK